MAERHKLDETEIASLVSAEIDAAKGYYTDEREHDARAAIEYYRGEMRDLPAEEGRSSVVDHTVQDVIGWLLPGLMRVFFSADQICVYEPKSREDEPGAKQATDYVNHVILREANAYQVFWDVFHDALLHRNGIVKHFWDPTPDTRTQKLYGLSEDQMTALTAPDDVEVLEHSQREETILQPVGMDEVGEPIMEFAPVVLHDVKVKVETSAGSLKLKAVAPENFLINRDAIDLEEARFVGERLLKTRSELLEMGFDREDVDELAAGSSIDFSGAATARTDGLDFGQSVAHADRSTEEVEVFECYPLADVDGDGIAERLKVICAGPSGAKILDWEVWEDDLPYSDLTPERVPHRWAGRSIFDDTQDIQRIKSTLMRQMLDNLYMSNVPDRGVDQSRIKNPDALFDRQIGNVFRTDGDPSTVIADFAVPFTAGASFQALEYMDGMVEKRTGVSRASMGLDPETLTNQTATAANIQQAASYSKVELIARNFAEMGLRRCFKILLRLIVKHQDRVRTVRLRNEWVEMDPRHWNADMDAAINVGLGSGSRDRDAQMLGMILMQQKEVLASAGIASRYGMRVAKAINHTQAKLTESTGLRGPDMYFPEVTNEELAEIVKNAGQGDGKAEAEQAKVQAQLQADMQKAQAEGQLRLQIAQAEGAQKAKQMQMDMEMKLHQLEAEIQFRVRQSDRDAEIKRYQIDQEMALKREQLEAELILKREGMLMGSAMRANGGTSAVHIGGDPG